MMPAKRTNKWFGKGSGLMTRYSDGDAIMFYWNGKPDGAARFIPHVGRYSRRGLEYKSLAALLRAIEAEHQEPAHV
jgi:hypothetical protein